MNLVDGCALEDPQGVKGAEPVPASEQWKPFILRRGSQKEMGSRTVSLGSFA